MVPPANTVAEVLNPPTRSAGASDFPADSEDRWGLALVALGRRAVASPDVELLMHDAAAMLAESLDADMSGVAELLDDGAYLSVQLTPSQTHSHTASARQRTPASADRSLAAFALAAGQPVASADLNQEARFTDVFLRKQQVRSAIACPLKLSDQAYGALLVGKSVPHMFAEQDLLFVEAIGHLITTTIARERAEQTLADQLRLDSAVLDTIEALVIVLDRETRIMQFNRACEQIAGFSLLELRQRAFCSAFLVPEEVRLVKGALDQLQRSSEPVEFESYVLTKHGVRRRIAWAFTRLSDAEGNVESLVGTGIDITEKCDLETKLERARALTGDPVRPAALSAACESDAARDREEDEISRARPFQSIPPGIFGDRRSRARRAYPYVQLLAPIVDNRLPPIHEFREVQCRDIGAGGFSFFAENPPAEADLIVAFGAGESLTYLTARQIHLTPTSRNGQSLYIVGCRYTGRTDYKS